MRSPRLDSHKARLVAITRDDNGERDPHVAKYMQLSYSDLLGLSIGALAQSKKAAVVCDVIVDPDSGKATALVVKKSLISFSPNAISWLDIREVDKKAVIIADEENILPMGELVRADELFRYGFNIVGLPVTTKQKRKLGKVVDYRIDGDTGSLISISVHGPWGYKAIISRTNIFKIEMDKIIVNSDTSSKKVVAGTMPELA